MRVNGDVFAFSFDFPGNCWCSSCVSFVPQARNSE
jgi:hypothetical protein